MTSGTRNRALFWGSATLVIAVDQVAKAWVTQALPVAQPVDIIPWLRPILSFTAVHNTGVAFGLFPGMGGLFTILSIVVVIAVLFFLRLIPDSDYWVFAGLGLVEGGAIGNLVDRIARGYVVDFVDVNFWPLRDWPVFNLADAAIVVGVAVLLLDSILNSHQDVLSDVGAPDLAS